ADDVERVASGYRAQPQSLCKRRVAEQGGNAGGGSTLRTQSAFAQMGHSDSPGRSRLSRDIHFEKSPQRAGEQARNIIRSLKVRNHNFSGKSIKNNGV